MGQSSPRRSSLRLPFHVTLVGLVLPLVLGSGLLISWIGYRRSSAMLVAAGDQLLAVLGGQLDGAIATAMDPERTELELDRLQQLAGASSLADRFAALPAIQQTLAESAALRAYFIGLADGQLFFVARASDAVGRRLPGLPPTAALVVESIAPQSLPGLGVVNASPRGDGLLHQQILFDAQLQPLPQQRRIPLVSPDFDPRLRPWYQLAQGQDDTVLSPVYRLAFGHQLGMTLSRRLPAGRGVVGASLELASLEGLLERLRPTPGSRLALVDDRGLVLVASTSGVDQPPGSPGASRDSGESRRLEQLGVPALQGLSAHLPQRAGRGFISARVQGEDWRTAVLPLPPLVRQRPLYLVATVPDQELLAGAREQQREGMLLIGLVLLVLVPVVVLVAAHLSRELRQLSAIAAAIRRFEFDAIAPPRSWVLEVDDLALTLESMRGTIQRFLGISAMLAEEDDVDQLLEKLLVQSIAAAGASAGALYLPFSPTPQPETGALPVGLQIDAPPVQPGFEPRLFHVGGQWDQPERLPRLDAAETEALLDGPPGVDQVEPLPDRPCLVMLLEDRLQHERLGLLLLWFEAAPEASQVAFCAALSGAAAVALETRELIADQKRLFEAFIQLIAGAIDAKSPYTGGHCERVPELTKLLAAAACEAREGPFSAFSLDAEGWEALHVASWLHDCGKVTTPEYVVDKATKLETIHDRIHEVRMRFELLKQQAETDYWQALARGGDAEALARERDRTLAELDEEFAFVATCNQGGEFMAAEQIERLQRIAARRWRRTLDDRLGVSREELRRRAGQDPAPLPCLEPLLADQPHHLIPRLERERFGADNPWGFRMQVPEHLYNRGELHNLAVARGTLSEEERFKINEHIIQTIRMLTALPFPRHLRRVPEIAGGHHEMVNGRGYPRALRGEQMSELARMMAIADIFEALTAADRPYKSGKTLSQALAIMVRMVADGHIDRELFELFLGAGVHRDYARRHLPAEQIDAVDEQALLASLGRPQGAT